MHVRTTRSPSLPRRLVALALAAVVGLTGAVAIAGPSAAPAGAAEPPGGYNSIVDGELVWGVKASFRTYVTGNIAHGTITTSDGATTIPGGAYEFPLDGDHVDGDDIAVRSHGEVHFSGHDGQLDLRIWDVRLEIEGDSGFLVADVSSKPLDAEEPVLYDDVEFAELDLSGVTPTNVGDVYTWADIPATLTEDGVPAFADFYDPGEVLDPVSFSAELAGTGITFDNVGIDPMGETVTVRGTGFDPDANISTRVPVPVGMPAGVYVVFGRYAEVWQPSQGAPSSARQGISQKWPLPQESYDAVVDEYGPNPQWLVLEANGTFETTLALRADDTKQGSYGVVTYAGGGAAPNAAQETFTPVSFAQEFSDVPQVNPFFGAISWMVEEGITTGYDDGEFKPANPVTRQAMAAFVYRLAGEPEFPVPDEPTFSDVPESNPFYEAIEWLAYEGISEGYDDGTFKPLQDISRQAMSAFLYRLADDPPFDPPAEPSFSDVPDDHPFYLEIEWMAETGISTGYESGEFLPLNNTSRQATAAFLLRFDSLPGPAT